MSALPDWKSHGATNTKSLSLIHILLLILPRIRHVLTLPSMHFTIILSPPTSLMTRPNSSPCWGNTNSLRWDSLNTFLLPISKTYRNRICNINLKDYATINLNLLFGLNSSSRVIRYQIVSNLTLYVLPIDLSEIVLFIGLNTIFI